MMARLLSLIGIGRATLIDDSGEVQTLQVTEGARGSGGSARVTDTVPRITEYGFVSNLPDGAEVIVIRRDGERAKPIVIATQHRASRPTGLAKGDVWIYDARGHAVKFTADGVVINGGGDIVTVSNASRVRCECDIETTGDIISRCDGIAVSLNKLRDAYDLHDHPPVAGATTWGVGPPDKQV